MYSKLLEAFLAASRPEEIEWTEEQIIALVQKAVQDPDFSSFLGHAEDGKLESVTLSTAYGESEFILPLRVQWTEGFEGGKVTFIPQVLPRQQYSRGQWQSVARDALMAAAGLKPVTVELPPVVQLPRAPWDNSWSYNDFTVDTLALFASEVAEVVGPFIQQLAGLISSKVPANRDELIKWLEAWGFTQADHTYPPGVGNGLLLNWLKAAVERGAITISGVAIAEAEKVVVSRDDLKLVLETLMGPDTEQAFLRGASAEAFARIAEIAGL